MSWNSARGLFIIAEAWAAAVFVICSAFVINSITKASAPCHVVKVKPLARGLSLLLLQLRGKVEATENSSRLHVTFGTETLQLMGRSICFSSRGWAFFLTSLLQWVKWEFGGVPPFFLYPFLYKERTVALIFWGKGGREEFSEQEERKMRARN